MTTSPPCTIATVVEQIVRQINRVPDTDADLTLDLELHDAGYIDSLGIVTLTARIEQTFGITLAEEDLFDPRFTTIAGIAAIIRHRQSNRPAA